MIERLERVVDEPSTRPPRLPFADRMQQLSRDIAFSPGTWTPARKREIAELFDRLSADWRQGVKETRDDALEDALARGRLRRSGLVLDVGSGTGVFTKRLASHFERLVVVDLSLEMLGRDSAAAVKVCADAAELPLPNGSAEAVVISNCFLFPLEVNRVLAPGGALLWVSAMGPDTPIYLSVDEIVSALPGAWTALTADAGGGSWAVFRRHA